LKLYERYAVSLRRFLQGGFSFQSQGRVCRFKGADSSIDAESLVQETFARAFAKTTRQNYDGLRPFQTYLFSIAKNLVLRECNYRDRMVSNEFVDESDASTGLYHQPSENSYGGNPERRAQNEQLKEIIQGLINELTSEEKSFFSFRFAKGLTQEATADRMGTTRARVKLLEKNVRKRFLDELRGRGYFVDYVPNPRWKRVAADDDIAQEG